MVSIGVTEKAGVFLKVSADFGARVKRIRLSFGDTMETFGGRLNPPAGKSLVSKWERGVVKPSPARIKEIAELGKMPIEYLTDGNANMRELRLDEKIAITNDLKQQASEALTNYVAKMINPEVIGLYTPGGQMLVAEMSKLVLIAENHLATETVSQIEATIGGLIKWHIQMINKGSIDDLDSDIQQAASLLKKSADLILKDTKRK